MTDEKQKQEKTEGQEEPQAQEKTGEEKKHPILAKEPGEIIKIARGIYEGRIFCDLHIDQHSQHLLGSIFMPLLFGALSHYENPEDIGMLYESLDKAGPRSINGYPVFSSMGVLNKADAQRVLDTIKHIEKTREDEEQLLRVSIAMNRKP